MPSRQQTFTHTDESIVDYWAAPFGRPPRSSARSMDARAESYNCAWGIAWDGRRYVAVLVGFTEEVREQMRDGLAGSSERFDILPETMDMTHHA